MADAPPAAAAAPPALSSPEAVDFLAMLAERQTATEARLDALSATFTAYTAVMPCPKAYYIVLEQPEGVQLVDVRRRVLEAIALDRRHPECAFVRCFLGTYGPWELAPGSSAALVFVTFDSVVETDPAAAAAEFASMHVNLARCGTRVAQTHTVLSDMEEQHFLLHLQDDEVFVPIRAAEAPPNVPGLPLRFRVAADFALGWCTRGRSSGVYLDVDRIENWAEVTGFDLFVPQKGQTAPPEPQQ
jgi:hypothetical protein